MEVEIGVTLPPAKLLEAGGNKEVLSSTAVYAESVVQTTA